MLIFILMYVGVSSKLLFKVVEASRRIELNEFSETETVKPSISCQTSGLSE